MSVRLLGPVDVVNADGERVSLGPTLHKLLAALALRPRRAVPREKLIDDIWPGVDDLVARHRLHTAMSKLRSLLASHTEEPGRSLIRWSTAGYMLDVADEELDWTRFRCLAEAGERALHRGAPALARSYLSAALSLWRAPEPLAGVEVAADDLGLLAEQIAGREQAQWYLFEARLQLEEYAVVTRELEARVAGDPIDTYSVERLALAYHRSGRPDRALAVCERYLELAAQAGSGGGSDPIADLQTAILDRDPGITGPAVGRTTRAPDSTRERPVHRAFLSAAWEPFTTSPTGYLAAELHLVIDRHGGAITDATETSIEASFEAVRRAVEGALALQRALDPAPGARVGVEARPADGLPDAFAAPARARARLLAAVARDGEVLISDAAGDAALGRSLPADATLRSLGSHRLNALAPSTPVFQLVAPGLPRRADSPRWLHRGLAHNLPDSPFTFVGRERDVAEVTERLAAHALVTLTGAPGSGKTRLAAHVAEGLSGEYHDGVWFVGLHAVGQPGLVAAAVADGLDLRRAGGVDTEVALVRHLSDRHVLIVLDNCEHLVGACRALLDRLLAACPATTVLATSRQALGCPAEVVVPVAPLDPPPRGPTDAILDNDAVRVFLDRLESRRSSVGRVHRSPREVAAAARICRAVDGIPLALVLAAARARELGTVELADALDATLGEGEGLGMLVPLATAETTLHDTLDWSYRLLGAHEQELLERLSVLRAGFTMDDAVAVSAAATSSRHDVEAAVAHLVQASMVNLEHSASGPVRLRLLQPIRDFAAGKLARRHGRIADARRSHAQHFLSVAEAAEPNLRGRQQAAVLDRVEASLPDLYASIRWAIEEGETNVALRLVGCLWGLWLVRGRIQEGRELLEAALGADRGISMVRAKALVACSQMAWFGGDVHRVRDLCRETLVIAECLGDAWAWAWANLGLAAVEMFNGEDDGVPQRIAEVIPCFRQLGNDWDTGQALQTLGGAAWHRGQYAKAEQALSESLALYRALGHPTLMASLLAHGLVRALLGHVDAGAAEVDESIVAAYETGDLVDLSCALCHRAAIARYSGHHDLARHHYREALRLASEVGQAWMIQWAMCGLASTDDWDAEVPKRRLAASVEVLARAQAMARETGITLAPRERECRARDIGRARARLGAQAFRAAFARGERLSVHEAIDVALHLK